MDHLLSPNFYLIKILHSRNRECHLLNILSQYYAEDLSEKKLRRKIRAGKKELKKKAREALKNGESFSSPEADMTFSKDGLNGMAGNFHKFINIFPGK